jgi:prevent-host-death family protein
MSKTPTIHIADDIVPIAELKAHLSEVVRGLPRRGRPVVVTQNGRAAAVLISPAAFDRLSHRARFVAAVEEGIEDIRAGRVLSDGAVEAILDSRYGAPPKAVKRRR